MLTLRYYIRLFTAFVGRFKAILLLGVVIGIVAFILTSFISPTFFMRKTEKIGVTGRYTTQEIPTFIVSQVGEGLTAIDDTGEVKPGLSSKWATLDEGKTWTFYLDKTKNWQDGKPVTASSISYTFSDVEIQRPNEETITFKLKERFAPFPAVLSKPIFRKGFLGTGEWKVAKLSLAGNFVEKITIQDKEGNKKTYRFYPTEEQTKLAFKLGEVDTLLDIIDPAPLSSWKVSELTEEESYSRYVAVFFNMKDPLFDDNNSRDKKPLRQALSYAIDKENLSQVRAVGPISPLSWAFNPQVKTYDYDPDRAKGLLSDLPKEAKNNLDIKLTTTPILIGVAEKIVKNWNDIGIKSSVVVSTTIPTEYQAFLAIYDSPPDPDQYVTWHSSQGETNISKYNSPRIDKLLEDGRLEVDQNERKKIYLDFQRFLLEDAPAAFLYHPVSYTIKRK